MGRLCKLPSCWLHKPGRVIPILNPLEWLCAFHTPVFTGGTEFACSIRPLPVLPLPVLPLPRSPVPPFSPSPWPACYNAPMTTPAPNRYAIPAGPARVELRFSNSRFIGTAGYTPTVEAAKALVNEIRDEMPDASHHVFGYVVGYGATVIAGMSDDGEPSGTAGRPVLAVVRGSGLGDLCIVVTRYFGGTLLGTGGLVKAYGATAKEVLQALPRMEKIPRCDVQCTLPYALYEQCKLIAAAHDGIIMDEEFAAAVTIHLSVPVDHLPALQRAVRELSNGQIAIETSTAVAPLN